jgi:hypothetical protein
MNFGALLPICKPDLAAVRFHDRSAKVKAHAKATALGCVEGSKWLGDLINVETWTSVTNDDLKPALRRAPSLDADRAGGVPVALYGLVGIAD